MNIKVDKDLRTPLYWQIAAYIRKGIIEGSLVDGAPLPSERKLAQQLSVHRNTVIKAYDVLKDEGCINAHHGKGYFVQSALELPQKTEKPKAVNWVSLIKDEYMNATETFDRIFLKFSKGKNLSLSTGISTAKYDSRELAEKFADILEKKGDMPFDSSPYQGDESLVHGLKDFFRGRGILASSGQIQVLSETNQALDFIMSAIGKPGDNVLVEEPLSPDVFRVIRAAGCKPITVPVDENGMICTELENMILIYHPVFIYVSSAYQDPTGTCMSADRRREVLRLSEKHRVAIIEEDSTSGLAFDGPTPASIKSMDKTGNVIYIYGFTMTYVPGLSLAAVVADRKVIKTLSAIVSIRLMTLDWITQKLLAGHLQDGKYTDALDNMAKECKEGCSIAMEELDRLGLSYFRPKGGMYIWCKLPDGVDSQDVFIEASRRGLSVIPGDIFYPNGKSGHDHLRLNYAYEGPERLREGFKILGQVINKLQKRK